VTAPPSTRAASTATCWRGIWPVGAASCAPSARRTATPSFRYGTRRSARMAGSSRLAVWAGWSTCGITRRSTR